jgi:hypothetical protein
MDRQEIKQYTLFTNIRFAQFQEPKMDLRMHISGLLISLSNEKGQLNPGNTLRGFGTEASNDRFSFWLPDDALPFELIQQTQDERYQMLSGKPGKKTLKPLFSGGLLKFANGMTLFIQTEKQDYPIDIFTHDDITTVWQELFDRAIKYWDAPFMPHCVYHAPSASEVFRKSQ